MNPAEIIALLSFLDTLFSLGGKLLESALEKAPILKIDALPDLLEMKNARDEAIKRINTPTSK